MATNNVLVIKRGLQANLPVLAAGEIAFTTDTKKFYVGDGEHNICINDLVAGLEKGNVVAVQEDGKINPSLVPEPNSIDASKLTGTIDLARLPHGALERLVVVADDAARLALTTAQVQNGDTVKVTASNRMYFVVDDTKLNEETGYEIYTAGTATAVAWAGVTEKPTTVSGYGITDALTTSATIDCGTF